MKTSNHSTKFKETLSRVKFDAVETLGEKVYSRIERVVTKMAKGEITEDKIKDKEQAYRRPQNIQMWVPKVDHSTKSTDLKAQRQQKLLLTATYALTTAWDLCLKTKTPVCAELVRNIADATGLLLKASHDVSMTYKSSQCSIRQQEISATRLL